MIEQTKEKMDKSIKKLQHEFSSIRSGAAHPSFLENLNVVAYGNRMPLLNLATISVQDPTTLVVQVWDLANVIVVDKAIRGTQLSLNPKIEGSKLFISLPPITTERRIEFIKIIKNKAEEGKISIRNLRRIANDKLKEQEKSGEFGEDQLKGFLKNIQNLTDQYSSTIDTMVEKKERDLTNL